MFNLQTFTILMKIPILLLLVGLALSQAVLPSPHCKFRPIFTTIPLTITQILSSDLSDFAFGYNLEFSIRTGSQFASLPKKLVLNDQLSHNFTRLISHFVEHKGNKWGTHMHFLIEQAEQFTYLYSGIFKDHDKTPEIDANIIEVSKVISCFDVVVFPNHQIALVDCMRVNETTKEITNVWLYFDIAQRQVVKTVDNQMYSDFKNITKRKLTRMHDPATGYEYVLRAYLAGGVDADNVGNTYLEVFSAYDPMDLQIMKVVDRSYLGLNLLAITDFKVYLGDIFVLDYLSGLFRLDITKGQHVTITGRYLGDGFLRFSVYSDDLDEQVLVALANSHAVYQINWDRPSRPYLVSKYSLMLHSHIQDIVISRQYLIVQSTANATTDTGPMMVNYTWIFSKNSRTYMNAYKVIGHTSADVFIDLDRYSNTLLITSNQGIFNYQINDPIISIQQPDSSLVNTSATLLLEANSTDPYSIAQIICNSRSTVYFVSPQNTTIWNTGITVPQQYYANYPGFLQIYLLDYVIGPNISFSVLPTPPNPLPPFYINQQNISTVQIDKPPVIGDIRFFHTDVVPHYGNDTVIYYYQDINNVTHVASCFHQRDDIVMTCRVMQEYAFRGRIRSFTSAVFADQRGFNQYWYMYVLDGMTNVVFVVDYIRHVRLATIELEDGMEGDISHLATSNGYLYLTVSKMKTIYGYKLSSCSEFQCKRSFTIDSKTLKAMGVAYFSPREIITTRQHPEVIFIKTIGSVVILDVDNNQNLILLNQIFSPAIRTNNYKLAVNKNSLVIVASPDIIEQYDLREMYSKRNIVQQKNFALYYYTIPVDFDLEFSDIGDLFYINAVNTRTNSTTVLIYRTSNFAVAALYDVINLPGNFNHNNLEIEVSGYEVDFVSVIYSGHFILYRQYEWPHVVMTDPKEDTSFQIAFNNGGLSRNLTKISLRIANYPQAISPTEEFQKAKKTFQVVDQDMSTFETRKWFTGHVLHYNHSCPDCDSRKVRVLNPISYMQRLKMRGNDYAETFRGGVLLWDDLFRLHTNGSVRDVILLPDSKMDEQCLRVVSRNDDSLIITGCEVFGWGVNLYMTSLAGEKAFTWGPYRSAAVYMRNLELVHNILAVVDVDFNPWRKYRSGGVYLYATDMDPITGNQLEELDYIDSNDFQAADGWNGDQAFVGNAQLVYDPLDDAYRLYVSEVSNGFFVLDFKYVPGSRQIQVLTTNYIDVNKLLKEHNLHMPKDATFLAISLVASKYIPHYEMQTIVLTTNGFHDFQIAIIYDQSRVQSTILHRVFYRYAYYETNNYVRASNGYVAVSYTAPYDKSNITQQIIAVYDAKDYEGESQLGYSERYMLGGYLLNYTDHAIFAFNSTFDPESNGTRAGLVVIQRRYSELTELRLSRNLTVVFNDRSILDQKITLTPYNDFSNVTFEIEVTNSRPGPEPEPDDGGMSTPLEVILLVIAILTVIGFVGYLVILFFKKPLSELEKSLVEDPEPIARRESPSLMINESERNSQQEPQNFEAPAEVYEDPELRHLPESVVEAPKASSDNSDSRNLE